MGRSGDTVRVPRVPTKSEQKKTDVMAAAEFIAICFEDKGRKTEAGSRYKRKSQWNGLSP